MASNIKVIARPPRAQLRHKAVRQEVAKQINTIGRLHVNERKRVVADFETDINFGYEVKITPKQVTLDILVLNDNEEVSEDFTVFNLWQALDRTGTRPHPITPKRPDGFLRFQTGYRPHTRPVARFGGPGQATGKVVYAKSVQHPGFPPRKFSESINKRLRSSFLKAVSRGISIGWRKAK